MNILHKFNQFTVLQALSIIVVITGSVLVSNTALADSRFSFNNDNRNFASNNSKHNGRNTGFQSNNTHYGTYNSSRNNSYRNNSSRNTSFWNSQIYNNARFNNNFNRNRFNTYNPYGNRYRNDNWSINLNLGNSWNNFSSFYTPRHTQTRVIYTQPAVVVVNGSSRSTGAVTRTTAETYEYSLLRDIHGNCFERSYDNQGREVRVQLPDAECNF
jgi:hypothetical protein